MEKNKPQAFKKEWQELQDFREGMRFLDDNYSENEKWIIYQEFEDRYHKYLRAKYSK